MKVLFAILLVVLASLPSFVKAKKMAEDKNKPIKVYRRMTVRVMNPYGIRNRDKPFDFGDECEIQKDDFLWVIKKHKNTFLVSCHLRREIWPKGQECPNQTWFFISKKEFFEMARLRKEDEKLKKLVIELSR